MLIDISREIDRMLPAEDIVVAGTLELYLGMPQRLNFAGTCSFTWGKPEYWPLTAPQAIIHTPGLDRGCDQLPDWLIDHNFQPAGCFPVPGVGDGVVILYLLPELMPAEAPSTARQMTWPGWRPPPDTESKTGLGRFVTVVHLGNTGLEPVTSPTSKERSAS